VAFRVEVVETIDRPIEDVFERLVDLSRYPEWMSKEGLFVSCAQESEGPIDVGTVYSDKTRLGTVKGEVSAFRRPDHVVFHYTARLLGRRVMEGWPGYSLQREGDRRTRVRHVAEGHLHGPFRLLQPLVRRLAYRERHRTVEALKRSLESSAPRRASDPPGRVEP
jgi:uncharacterized protein YndB with AHSA1/START domain